MFEQYLIDIHAALNRTLDDEMPDNYTEWLCDMDPDDMIRHADNFCQKEKEKAVDKSVDRIKKLLRGES